MRIMFLSQDGSAVGIAHKFGLAGNDVLMLQRKETLAGKGMIDVKVIPNYSLINILTFLRSFNPELVIIDKSGLGTLASKLFEYHIPIIGGNEVVDSLVEDEKYAKLVLGCAGVRNDFEGGVWCNGKELLLFTHSQTFRRMCNDDVGPMVECMGVLMRIIHPSSPIGAQLKKLEQFLVKANYHGYLHLCGGKVSAGLGYDGIFALAELLNFRLLDMLVAIATGNSFQYKLSTNVACSIRVLSPSFGSTIGKLEPIALKHTWLKDVVCEDGEYKVAGQNVLSVSAIGNTRTSISRCYRSIRMLRVPDGIYRTDIGKGVKLTP